MRSLPSSNRRAALALVLGALVAGAGAVQAQERTGDVINALQAATGLSGDDPSAVEGPNTPSIADISRQLVMPRFGAFARAAARLQNIVLRRCSIDGHSSDDLEAAFVDTMFAGSAAVSLAFGSEFNRTAATSVMSPFGDEGLGRTQFAVLMGSAPDGPATLTALRSLEPSYVGLPALGYALFDMSDADGSCDLAMTLAANVATVARTMERRWEAGLVEAQWTDPTMPAGSRRRLFDMLVGLLRTLSRTEDVLSPRPRGPLGRVSGNGQANAAFVQGRFAAMLDIASTVNAYAVPGSAADQRTQDLMRNLRDLSIEARALTGSPSRATAATMATQVGAMRPFVQNDVAAAFGFAPEALVPLLDGPAPGAAPR